MKIIVAMTAIFLLMCAGVAKAAPLLYRGELTVRKASGKACPSTVVGQVSQELLLIDQNEAGVNGWIHHPELSGRFSGLDLKNLTLNYPLYDKSLAGGNTLSLDILGDVMTGQLREKHLPDDVNRCNFDEAELKLTLAPQSATVLSDLSLLSEKNFTAQARHDEAEYWFRAGDKNKAIPLYEQALPLREEVVGKSGPLVAAYLKSLALAYGSNQQFDKAIALLEARIPKFTGGEANSLKECLALIWNGKGNHLQLAKNFPEALTAYRSAMGLDPEAVNYLGNAVSLLTKQEKLNDAKRFLAQGGVTIADAEGKKVLSQLWVAIADGYVLQAKRFITERNFNQAIPLYLAALEIDLTYRRTSAHVDLVSLGYCYREMQEWQQAEGYYQQALSILEAEHGPESKELVVSLQNLAWLKETTGRYAAAELFMKRVLAIQEKTKGAEHADLAASLDYLASLYQKDGRYAEAEQLYRRTLAIAEKKSGSGYPEVATSLINLAGLYETSGRFVEAEALFQRGLAIVEKTMGSEHPAVAGELSRLAVLYHTTGRYTEAESLFLRSLAIRERTLGPDHADTALSLNNLAGLYQATGRYAEAEPLLKRSLAKRVR